jgi:hypothetical protein
MRSNIFKVSERGERLDSLQDKTDNLAVSAQGFRRGANRVRKQMWWKDMKMRVCLIICIILLLVVIIVPAGKTHPEFRAMRKISWQEDANCFRFFSCHYYSLKLRRSMTVMFFGANAFDPSPLR